jgi:hypothetical protein
MAAVRFSEGSAAGAGDGRTQTRIIRERLSECRLRPTVILQTVRYQVREASDASGED